MVISKKKRLNGEEEWLTISFKSKRQSPFIMICKEIHVTTDNVVFADVVWSTSRRV